MSNRLVINLWTKSLIPLSRPQPDLYGRVFLLETTRSFETHPLLIYLSYSWEETDIAIWVRDPEGSVMCQRQGTAGRDFSVIQPSLVSLHLFYTISLFLIRTEREVHIQ